MGCTNGSFWKVCEEMSMTTQAQFKWTPRRSHLAKVKFYWHLGTSPLTHDFEGQASWTVSPGI